MDESRKPVCIPTKDGFMFVSQEEIIYMEARHNYCCIHLAGQRSEMVPVNIQKIMDILVAPEFCRIHKSYVVYLPCIRFMNSRKTRVYFLNGKYLPVGRSYLPSLLQKIRLMKL